MPWTRHAAHVRQTAVNLARDGELTGLRLAERCEIGPRRARQVIAELASEGLIVPLPETVKGMMGRPARVWVLLAK